MPNFSKLFKDEVQRLARKEARALTATMKRETIRTKKALADLRKDVNALLRQTRAMSKTVASAAAKTVAIEEEGGPAIRPTSKMIQKLRLKFKMTQAELGKLIGVSALTVSTWENKGGRITLRSKPLQALSAVRGLGAREARRRLEELQPAKAAKAPKGKKKAKPAKKAKVAKAPAAKKIRKTRKPRKAAKR